MSWVQTRPIKVLSKTSLEVLGGFSLDELTQMPLEELALFVAQAGKNRSPDPEAIASELQKAARESYRIRPELSSSVASSWLASRELSLALKGKFERGK